MKPKMNKSYIFLDDERFPKDVTWLNLPEVPWTIVRNVEEFKAAVIANYPNFITFDHDLGEDLNNNGYRAALWLTEHCMDNNLPLPDFSVHSKNPIGIDRINSLLNGFSKHQRNER